MPRVGGDPAFNVPFWSGANNGPISTGGISDLSATNKASQINQFLGGHTDDPVYYQYFLGRLVNIIGGTNFQWSDPGALIDYAQPFTWSGSTSVTGKVEIPLLAVGNGADVRVSICNDQGGGSNPDLLNPLSSSIIPASWLVNLGAQFGLASGGSMAHPTFNTLFLSGGITSSTWSGPAAVSGSPTSGFSSCTTSGNYFLMAGGKDGSSNPLSLVSTAVYEGGTTMGPAVAQPSLPAASYNGALSATNNTLVYMGGRTGSSDLNTVYTASWDPNSGVVGSWSSQPVLPANMVRSSSAVNTTTGTVYVAGGLDSTNTLNANVYYATVTNGQITGWNTGPQLPSPVWGGYCAVLGNFLIYAGGSTTSATSGSVTNVYFASLDPVTGQIIGTWNTGPSLLNACMAPGAGNTGFVLTDSALCIMSGNSSGSDTPNCQILTANSQDLATNWTRVVWTEAIEAPWAAFSSGNSGEWQIFRMAPNSGTILSSTFVPVPLISVPIDTALFNGLVYHVVVQVGPGQDASSSVEVGFVNSSSGTNAITQARHHNNDLGGSWTNVSITGVTAPASIPINIYTKGSNIFPGYYYPSHLLHTREDTSSQATYGILKNQAARTSTYTKNFQGLVTGVAECVTRGGAPLNRDPYFQAGTTYYTAEGASSIAVVASPSPVTGVTPFSGRITVTSTSPVYAKLDAEIEPAVAPWSAVVGGVIAAQGGFWYMTLAKVYCSLANQSINLSMDWFDSSMVYISTTSAVFGTVPANTWKDIVGFHQPPAGSAAMRVAPVLNGSAVSTTLHVNSLIVQYAPECVPQFAPVTQLTYNTAAGTGSYPSGTVQLA